MSNAPLPPATGPHRPERSSSTLVPHLPAIRRIVRLIGQRHRLDRADEADLFGDVVLRLMADDSRVLREYRGSSTIGTYLHVVIYRVLLDTRTKAWGKWRPSARARMAGEAGIHFERLVARDGLSVTEARTLLQHHPRLRLAPEVADALGRTVRSPHRRRALPLHEHIEVPLAPSQDADLHSRDLQRRAHDVRAVARRALQSLDAADLTLLRQRFVDGHSVADIARHAGVRPQPLYRRYVVILKRMRARLEAAGVKADEVRTLLDHQQVDIGALL